MSELKDFENMNSIETPVPAPEHIDNTTEDNTLPRTADDIHAEIIGSDEKGYCPCAIIGLLEKIHNLMKDPEHITDADHEFISEIDPEFCRVDMYSLDSKHINLVFTFDSPEDVYLKEFEEFMKLSRKTMEDANEQALNDDNTPVPVISFTFSPYKYEGKAMATFAEPISYFRTLGDDNKSCCMHLLFDVENIEYQVLDMEDDDVVDAVAEVLRTQESAVNSTFN